MVVTEDVEDTVELTSREVAQLLAEARARRDREPIVLTADDLEPLDADEEFFSLDGPAPRAHGDAGAMPHEGGLFQAVRARVGWWG